MPPFTVWNSRFLSAAWPRARCRAIHRFGFGRARSGDANLAVHRVGLHIAAERSCFDLSVHRSPDEAHARRDMHRELHLDIVIIDAHTPAGSWLAFVGAAPVARRVDRADGDAIAVRHRLNGDGIRIVVAPAFGGTSTVTSIKGAALGVIAPLTPDFDRLSRSERPLPVEVAGLAALWASADNHKNQAWFVSPHFAFSSKMFC